MRLRIPIALLTAFAGATLAGSATAQTPIRVALSGTAAPAGGNYNGFSIPALNGAGQLVFFASLTGGSSTEGIFTGLPGSLSVAALQGTSAPAGGNFNGFSTPVLNGSGQVAFTASLAGGSSSQGLFTGLPGALSAAALQGTAAPAGGNYNAFGNPVLNGAGQVAFQASLAGGSSAQGIFAGLPGSVQAVALLGTAAPAGGNYNTFGNFALNGSGRVAFLANLTGGSSTSGLFAGLPGSLSAVALQGTPAPAGGNYNTFPSLPRLNGAGQVAFVANLTGGSSTRGIFAGLPGALSTVALQGTPAPVGGNYSGIISPVLNESGQVAFAAGLTGGSATSGLFTGLPGSLSAVALQGTPAPAGSNYNSLLNFALNGAGQVAFTANLTGTGVTTANDLGLYAGFVGNIVKVVREGDIIDVDPGAGTDLRTVADDGIAFVTVSGGQDGRNIFFADNGALVYRLAFTDGSSGVFTSVVPVPEPGCVLAFAGLAAIVGWRLRRAGVGKSENSPESV